ncbi:response regulator [Gorillibacterium timonense]|uniref:response regulator n=1 Tax=Gorillibacterium timonense TaxID=1689269 RepID=UPI00071CDDD5|nr:response regulator [Gorillibacterium timonense]
MKVIVIDDERSMHMIMERMLKKINSITLVGCFYDTWSAYTYLSDHDVDIIFVDISMPKESGLEFAKRLRDEGRETKIIFVTSHKEYALPAFDVYALDYMLKPVNQERLQQTIERAVADMELQKNKVRQAAQEHKLIYNCLGTMELRTPQNELIKWRTSKSAELFAYLIMQKGKRVSRARIIEDMFDHMPLKNAETYLNTTVYQLRKLLSNHGFSQVIYSGNQHYSLDYSQIHVDAFRFEDQCNRMDFSNERQVNQAVEHEKSYRGHLFGEYVYRWAQNEVERLFLVSITFSHKLCEALLNRAEMDKAISILKKLVDSYELEDRTMMLYLEALALKQDEVGLKRQYKTFIEIMREDVGVSVSTKVTDYYYQLIEKLN